MFPKLRFKEFDDDWSPYVLKDFVSFRKGKGISKADISENGINECANYWINQPLIPIYGLPVILIPSRPL